MPNKVKRAGERLRNRMSKIKVATPKATAMIRKYRSSANWQKVVLVQKGRFPLCCDPHGHHADEGNAVPMAQVHHVKMLATHYHLRNFYPNLRSLCVKCHDKVSKMERSGKPTEQLFAIMPEC